MEKKFWQTSVEITRVPDMERRNLEEISWFTDSFGDGRVYGTKFTIGKERFRWKFFLKEESKFEALKAGHRHLTYLRELYPGLDGIVSAKQIETLRVKKSREVFYELILPNPPYYKNRISLIKKIVNLYEVNTQHKIKVYILWKSAKPNVNLVGISVEEGRKYKYDFNFHIKIFIEAEPTIDSNKKKDIQLAEFMGKLNYLTTEIWNLKGHLAHLKEVPFETKKIIMEMSPEFKTTTIVETAIMDYDTGAYHQLTKALNFSIPSNMPIEKANIVSRRKLNFSPIPKDKNPKLLLGHAYINDVLTKKKAYIGVSDLVHHMFICGLSGVGKTRFLGHLENQILVKTEKVGVLIVNLMKKNEADLFKFDYYLKYGDKNFRVPYYFEDETLEEEEREKNFEILAKLLVSSVGLKNVVSINMENVILSYYKKFGTLPESLRGLFNKLMKWFEDHPYHVKFQTNIVRALNNRVLKLLSSPILENVTKLPPIIPYWFQKWKEGRSIYVDLSNCKMSTKRLLVNLIFQTIRIHMPELKEDALKHVIMIDEVSEILEKPNTQNSDDDEYITRFHLEHVFTYFLQAFRSRGVALLLADQRPIRLFESVYSLPSVQILFRLAHSCSPIFTNNSDEQDSLALLRNRDAIINDGVNGKKYAFRTMNYFYQTTPRSSSMDEVSKGSDVKESK